LKILTVINKKGGVAKTTTALAIGAGLQLRGYKVLMIDLDSQCNMTMAMSASIEAKNVLGVLLEQVAINDAIQHTQQGDIVAASLSLAGADGVITETGKEYRLREALADLDDAYDYVVIDTPPSLGVLAINAMTASNWLIIPAQADMFSRDGLLQLNRAIVRDQKYCNSKLKTAGILLTRYSDRNVLSKNLKDVFDDIAGQMGTRVFSTTIRENISVKEAQVMHQSIYDYAPKSNGAADYGAFCDELITLIA
jgi:chromosome partitioning protein